MPKFRLANILLKVDNHLKSVPQMLYRAEGNVDYAEEDGSLAFDDQVDFLTYFNALSWKKWHQYTKIKKAFLHLELSGDPCTIHLMGVEENEITAVDAPNPRHGNLSSAVNKSVKPRNIGIPKRFEGSGDYEIVEIEFPVDGLLLGGFTLNTNGATALRNAYWYTEVPEEKVRRVNIALATTTFKKEEYIEHNIAEIKSKIAACDEPISAGFHMFVVDNGKTLDAKALSDSAVTVIPNANVGGAGGFARGMIAALESDADFTHVLLMDDDVRVSPESFKRTFNLLSLVSDEYVDAFINGAMLKLDTPNCQFEDVSSFHKSGGYGRIKGNLYVDSIADAAVNEAISVEVPRAYGAWWYACIPVSAIQEHGLPLPLFVRCDDVEYSMRCQPTYMTMNGICVWHEAFEARVKGSVDGYQYTRNYMIAAACDEGVNATLFLQRTDRILQIHLRAMAYEMANLIISGMEDYLKGPQFIMDADGEQLMKSNGALNEQLLPLDEAIANAIQEHPELEGEFDDYRPNMRLLRSDVPAQVRNAMVLVRVLPYDKHLLPDKMLKNKPATAFYGYATRPAPEQMATRVIVACDREGKEAHVRVMDRARHVELKRRWHKAKRTLAKHGDKIVQEYKDALLEMTSIGFWKDYLARAEKRANEAQE